ncbi:MAG: tryptophan--tRNA ligase [Patescibacteria group bacterium]|jgi:tryptophanyl-tRNA synthetase|nr:tryptophan--tRNA ligase [Patescibacteria group bacterium]
MNTYLSGIQATGDLHIGNYLGSIKPCVDLQSQGQAIYFVPNLHSLNVRPDPEKLRKETYANIAMYLAAGIDPEKSILYVQSKVSANSELCWILNNFVTMGELARQTQYKDKSSRGGAEGQIAALFTYPVLMAADILLYGATHVPVGEDQKQHVELARDIALRFNNLYGETFVVPEPVIRRIGARIMSLQDPSKKMSKSDTNQAGNILILENTELIKDKIMRAVTDSGSSIELSDEKPAISNLIEIYSAFSSKDVTEIQEAYSQKGYGEFKSDLASLVATQLEDIQARFSSFYEDKPRLEQVIEDGSSRAEQIAIKKLSEVKTKLGLL